MKASKGRESHSSPIGHICMYSHQLTGMGPPGQVQVRWYEMRRGEVRHDAVQTSKYPCWTLMSSSSMNLRFQGRTKLIWIYQPVANPWKKGNEKGNAWRIDWPNDNDLVDEYEWERFWQRRGWRGKKLKASCLRCRRMERCSHHIFFVLDE